MKEKTRVLKIVVALFCLCLIFVVPMLIKHVFSLNLTPKYLTPILISLIIRGINIGCILYATFRMLYLFEHDSIFTDQFVKYLKLAKNSLLCITIIGLANFGLMPTIAIVHLEFYDYVALTIDFITIFMFGLVAFIQLIVGIIEKGIEIKEEQALTI